jgi:hypothetical protein
MSTSVDKDIHSGTLNISQLTQLGPTTRVDGLMPEKYNLKWILSYLNHHIIFMRISYYLLYCALFYSWMWFHEGQDDDEYQDECWQAYTRGHALRKMMFGVFEFMVRSSLLRAYTEHDNARCSFPSKHLFLSSHYNGLGTFYVVGYY